MADPAYVVERQRQAGATGSAAPPAADSEEGRLLACALAAALFEYRRSLQCPNGDRAAAAGMAVEWRLLARWEQMAPPPGGGGRAWA
jgi:hypothetical protein